MLKLIKLDKSHLPQLNEMMDEWTAANEKIIPWSIRKCDYHDIDRYIESLEVKKRTENTCRIPPSSALIPSGISLSAQSTSAIT